jgi:sugar (pentulose or hexulose) kinase
MNHDSAYMGIDAGTTNLKLILYNADMKEIGSSSRMTVIYIPENGASEIDMDELWQALCDASQELKHKYPEAMASLKGLGISGQGDGLWSLDENGCPACRAILWNDSRSKVLDIDSIAGLPQLQSRECLNTVFAGSMPGIQKWLKVNHPETYARIRHSLHCKDWLNYCLTGRIVSEYSDITCSSGMNMMTLKYVPEFYDLLGIPEALDTMPEVVEPTDVIGTVSEEASARTGLPAGVKVIAGCLDCCAASAGTDFYRDGEGCSVIGTSMINEICQTPEQVNPSDLRGLLLYHVAPNRYIKIMNTAGGSSCVDFVRKLVAPEVSFKDLFVELEKIPVGSNGLIYHPYLYGERAPFKNPDACASFVGLRSYHTRFNMIRAAYEGIAMMFVDCYRAVGEVGVVYLSGGASTSPFVCQMFCDAIGIPVKRQTIDELGTLGIVKMLKVGLGEVSGYDELTIDSYVEYTPDPKRHAAYMALYKRFLEIRASLEPHWLRS